MAGQFAQIDRHTCTLCGACVESCPSNALSFDGRVVEAGEVVREILKDKDFYETSGGGMTLTGGDPLSQPEFSSVILTRCGEENIHRAMETALYTPTDILSSFAPLVDLFLVDLKVFDPGKHRRHTGVDNRLILDNFRALAGQLGDPSRLLVRIPLIPGFTAGEDNLRELAGFVRDIDARIPIELINYNPLAENKHRNMNRAYPVDPEAKPFSDRDMISLYDVIRSAGATVYHAGSHDRNR
jgi:pyruvate formate lyase activating enzyme